MAAVQKCWQENEKSITILADMETHDRSHSVLCPKQLTSAKPFMNCACLFVSSVPLAPRSFLSVAIALSTRVVCALCVQLISSRIRSHILSVLGLPPSKFRREGCRTSHITACNQALDLPQS